MSVTSFPKTWKEICSPNKCEIFASFQKEVGSVFRRREKGAVNVVIRNRHFFHSLKQRRCYKACRSDLSVRRTIWGHMANKFREAGSASAGKLQTCSSQDVFSGVWLCLVNRAAFRIGPGCVFWGPGVEGVDVVEWENILEIDASGCHGILKKKMPVFSGPNVGVRRLCPGSDLSCPHPPVVQLNPWLPTRLPQWRG